VVGADAGAQPRVKVYDAATRQLKLSFLAYESSFTGGVRVAAGDVTGDGIPDIITATGSGGGNRVRVFNGKTEAQLTGALGNFQAYTADCTQLTPDSLGSNARCGPEADPKAPGTGREKRVACPVFVYRPNLGRRNQVQS